MQKFLPEIKYDASGLVPAIVQDASTNEVLMLAYMNAESLGLSLSTGETHFWSRSRSELWHKGATSGIFSMWSRSVWTAMRIRCWFWSTLRVRLVTQGSAVVFIEIYDSSLRGAHLFFAKKQSPLLHWKLL